MSDIEPINLSSILQWAKKTAQEDRYKYRSPQRSLSASRLLRLLRPNLQKAIFVVGSPRSGTTFLGECLAVLPEISYHFEPVATKAAARYIYEGEWSKFQAKWFYRSVYAWLMRIHIDADLCFAEKTPRNCFLIEFLSETFPKAKFVHILRDGRDVALSYSKKPWLQAKYSESNQREPGGYKFGSYARFWVEEERIKEFETTSDLHRCIWAWQRHTQSALLAAGNLAEDRYFQLKYESLVAHPVEEGDRLLNFLQISDSNSRHLFHRALSKIRSDSVGAWKSELSAQQIQQIETEAGKLLRQLGYIN